MSPPEPRYLSRCSTAGRSIPCRSRWTDRRRGLQTSTPPPTPPPAYDLLVTGTLSPDVTGNYLEDGTCAGKPQYRREDSQCWIWWYATYSRWILSRAPGYLGPHWYKSADPVTGTYTPFYGATGTATVSAA